jgi:hypothetical protein
MSSTPFKALMALCASGLIAAATPAMAVTASHAERPASAMPGSYDSAGSTWNNHDRGRHRGWKRGRGHDNGYGYRNDDDYREQRYYDEPVYRHTQVWRGDDNRYYCRHSDGTTGLLIGGAAGALLGREVAGRRGDRTLGMILGAAGGALIGREIDGGGSRCR